MTADIFDFSAAENTYTDVSELVVKDIRGNVTSLVISFAGPAAVQTLDADMVTLREQLKRNEDWQKEAEVAVKEHKAVPERNFSFNEIRKQKAIEISRRIVTSTPFKYKGETLELKAGCEKTVELLSDPAVFDWLVSEQIVPFLSNKKNFTKPCAKTV